MGVLDREERMNVITQMDARNCLYLHGGVGADSGPAEKVPPIGCGTSLAIGSSPTG